MCWTPPYTGHKTKTNKTKQENTTQYVLDTNMRKLVHGNIVIG